MLLLALLFALPNVFGEDPALQVARKDHSAVTADAAQALEAFLRSAGFTSRRATSTTGASWCASPTCPISSPRAMR